MSEAESTSSESTVEGAVVAFPEADAEEQGELQRLGAAAALLGHLRLATRAAEDYALGEEDALAYVRLQFACAQEYLDNL